MHNFSPQSRQPESASISRSAFTLTELLVVIGIIALIAVVSVPAYNAFNQSQSLTRGASDLSLLLEYARTEAVARQTYVWVGAEKIDLSGRPGLAFGAVYSKDGTGTNLAAANLAPLNRAFQVAGVVMVPWGDLRTSTRTTYSGPTPASVATNTAGVPFQLGAQSFTGKTLTFTPRGEALLTGSVTPDEGYSEAIDISLRQTKGPAVQPDSDDLALLITGSTGIVRLIRVQ